MKIAIVTDAWFPQINGVVTTLSKTRQELDELGHETLVISPNEFKAIPCPTYPEIKLSLAPGKKLTQLLRSLILTPCILPRKVRWVWPRAPGA